MNKPVYLRGDIYYADLGEGFGSEQQGCRPVVIIQNNIGNKYSPTVIVAAISSKPVSRKELPTHCYIGSSGGLDSPSIVWEMHRRPWYRSHPCFCPCPHNSQ